MKIGFNYLKIFTQDYALGKFLSLVWSLSEMLKLAIVRPSAELWMLFGLVFKIKPRYSMLSTIRLITLYQLVRDVQQRGLKGDIVECGVWNGGAAAMMARSLQDAGGTKQRSLWLFDSFEGLPPPGKNDGKSITEHYFKGLCKGSLDQVKAIFDKLEVSFDHVKIVKGWLEDTLHINSIGQVVLLHIDTDWYESVKSTLEHMYDKVVAGGYIVVDDFYFHEGCRRAVSDFLKERGFESKIQMIKVDRSAVYFQKV
jgi:O-methyltransferase